MNKIDRQEAGEKEVAKEEGVLLMRYNTIEEERKWGEERMFWREKVFVRYQKEVR